MLNKVVLIGRLTRDPELRYTTNQNIAVVTFTLAVNRPFSSNQQGANDNNTNNADFIQCTAWRNQAENVSKYISKGSLVAVDGRLQTRDYLDKDNVKKYVTEVICDSVVFLESKGQRDSSPAGDTYSPKPNNDRFEKDSRDDDKNKHINIIEDDLPF